MYPAFAPPTSASCAPTSRFVKRTLSSGVIGRLAMRGAARASSPPALPPDPTLLLPLRPSLPGGAPPAVVLRLASAELDVLDRSLRHDDR
jgi:hypothetical protein